MISHAGMDGAFDGSSDRTLPRVTTLLAHSIPAVLVAYIVSWVAAWVTGSPIIRVIATTLAVVVVTAYLLMRFHQGTPRLCIRCMRDAPADPQRELSRKKVLLWWMHWDMGLKSIATTIATFAFYFLTRRPLGDDVALIPLMVLTYTSIYAFWAHHRLRPWCPWCRDWDEGGDHEVVPDPVDKATRS